jgi:alanine dehydrogenase
MIVGVPREVKVDEYRVALTAAGAEVLVSHDHEVLIESSAGAESGFHDADYTEAGGHIVDTAAELYSRSDMVLKVKEPTPAEYGLLKPGQVVFTYFHLASSLELTQAIVHSKCIAIAYETIETDDGLLPLLIPMSEVAGRMSVQQGAKYLEREHGGRGILLGGVPGVGPALVMILGGGAVGRNAARVAAGLGARVCLLDVDLKALRHINDIMPPNVVTMMSNPRNIRRVLKEADLVISSVLIHGAKAPKLITRDMLSLMKKGAVVVDVAIDQGGSLETSHPTTHEDPIYEVDGIVHYCVANMPGAMPVTSTIALTNATFPYALEIANKGFKRAIADNPAIQRGANVLHGQITYRNVAEAFDLPYTPVEQALG